MKKILCLLLLAALLTGCGLQDPGDRLPAVTVPAMETHEVRQEQTVGDFLITVTSLHACYDRAQMQSFDRPLQGAEMPIQGRVRVQYLGAEPEVQLLHAQNGFFTFHLQDTAMFSNTFGQALTPLKPGGSIERAFQCNGASFWTDRREMVADLPAGAYTLLVRVAFSCGEDTIDHTFELPLTLQ